MDRSKDIVQEEDLLGDNQDEDVEEDPFANAGKKGEEIFGKMNLHKLDSIGPLAKGLSAIKEKQKYE